MHLYFFRHGVAADAVPPAYDDAARPLTPEGVSNTQQAGRVLHALGLQPTALFSSPRVRAQQTAQHLAEALGVSVQVREEVNFGFDVVRLATLCANLPSNGEVLFVGHEPDMSNLVGALIGQGQVEMKKGGLARVDLLGRKPQAGLGRLVWMVAPRVFNAL